MEGSTIYKHALCLYPYCEDLKRGRYYPPLGLETVAAALAPFCEQLDIIDLRHETGIASDFVRAETDLVIISINWGRNTDFVREQIRLIPTDCFTVVGGRHATEAPETWLQDCPNIDILVRGDGDETIEEIAQGLPFEDIAGISYRQNGDLVHTNNRQYENIRNDIYPDRKRRRYRYNIDIEGVGTGVYTDSISGSRGCPFKCEFCSFNLNPWGEKCPYSSRSAKSVVDEIESMDADLVLFTDDCFNHEIDRVAEICELILKRGIKKQYIVNSRIEISKRMDVVRLMERAGFVALLLGIESAQDKTLKSMRKGFNTAKVLERFENLRKTKMILHGYFIFGCIGENEDEMLEIAPYARKLGIDTLGLSPLRTMPHDGLRDLVETTPGYHISSEGFIYSDEISRKSLKNLRRKIWRQFYTPGHILTLGWKLIRGGMVTPGLATRLLYAGARGELVRRGRKRAKRCQKIAAVL
ncbi:B12-binding domain-containing radical SAM protein [Planctomycetota bacterium]